MATPRKSSYDQPIDAHIFVTGTKFTGYLSKSRRCMEGYGKYTFLDGSEYVGYFSRGHFQGFGKIQLAKPHNVTIEGIFDQGELKKLLDITFNDGLMVEANLLNNGIDLDFERWNYCCDLDRRFFAEHMLGLTAVGKRTNDTANGKGPLLNHHSYDAGEGIYNSITGFLHSRRPPFKSTDVMFLACRPSHKTANLKVKQMDFRNPTADWITTKCRFGGDPSKTMTPQICQRIVRNNVYSEEELGEYNSRCGYDVEKLHKHYFSHICKCSERSESPCDITSLSSCDSQTMSDVETNVFERLITVEEHDKYNTTSVLEKAMEGILTKNLIKPLSRGRTF